MSRFDLGPNPVDGNVWVETSHGLTVSVLALYPAEARAIAKALIAAADKAGGKLPATLRREKP